jgi:hypothetical protein
VATSNDVPWSGLEAGATDTRRVSALANWGWFWAVMPRADVALLLQLAHLPEPLPDLPRLKSLEIKFQTLPGGPILYIRLKDGSQRELFETLCRDVIAAGEQADTEEEALKRAIGRTFRWHYLLRGGKPGILSEEAQKGLIGEIEIFKLLAGEVGPKTALAAWAGPLGAPKDFELEADFIEVKARRGASKPFIRISSEHQLADVPGGRLWLAVLAVDRVQPPHGHTLVELALEVRDLLEQTTPSLVQEWDLRLAEAGFDALDDYSAWRWIVSKPTFYDVTTAFPRVAAPVPLGVSAVTYSLELSACQPFITEWAVVQSRIRDGRHE